MRSLIFAFLLTLATASNASVTVYTCYQYQSSPTPQQLWLLGKTEVTGEPVDFATYKNVNSITYKYAPEYGFSGYGVYVPIHLGVLTVGWSPSMHKTCPQDPYQWQTYGDLEYVLFPGNYYMPAGPLRSQIFACLS